MIERSGCWLVVGLCIAANCFAAPIDWPHLKLTRIAQGLSDPVRITSARDGTDRIFIAERFGKIKVVVNGELQSEPFLDITTKVNSQVHYTYGILGLAFPPNFGEKQYFYVHYTRSHERLVLSRFHVPPGSSVAAPESEELVMTNNLPFEYLPHGGHLEFGPDGYLYIGLGAPYFSQPQALNNAGGKILRIDTELTNSGYVIPPDNPFAGHPTNLNEIWAWGLLLPYGFSFDRLTGDFYMVDKRAYSCEVNFQSGTSRRGVDYGWPNPENYGTNTYATQGAEPPAFTIDVREPHLVGGYVYRGQPASRMNGIFICGGHYFPGLVGFARDGSNWIREDFLEVTHHLGRPVIPYRFGEDDTGQLYIVSPDLGALDRVEDSGKARPPVLLPSGIIHTDTPVLTSLSLGARIRYTTDGRDPAPGDPEIPSGQSITISTGMTVKAQALRDDLLPSDISAATYTSFKAAYPIFVPGPGPVPNPTSITITSATPGAIIRYTTNGSQPTPSSPIYSSPITVPGDGALLARAYRVGFQDSDLNGATYTWATAEAPVFDPASGPITNGTWITMTSPTPGAKIRYTIDGTQPTATSLRYTNRIRITGNTTVKAITFARGYKPSPIASVFFARVKAEPPIISPSGGVVTNGTWITMSCPTPYARIRYTLDGTIPGSNSPVFKTSLFVPAPTTVRARAYAPEMDPSKVTVADFAAIVLERTIVQTVAGNGHPGFVDGAGSRPQFNHPHGLCVDKHGNLYIADTVNCAVRKIDTNGLVTTLAGSGIIASIDGVGTNASFSEPVGIAIHPNGNLYVADRSSEMIRMITPAGKVRTIANIRNRQLYGLCHLNFSSDGLLYIGSFRLITTLTTAGNSGSVYDGIHNCQSTWDNWDVWTSVALDAADRVYAVNGRQLLRFKGTCETVLAGGTSGFSDGPPDRVRFSLAWGLAIASNGKAFIADGQYVRILDTNGYVSTLAGWGPKGFRNGSSAVARFQRNIGICIDSRGAIYVADADNHAIRRISFDRDQDAIPDPDEGTTGPFRLGRNDALIDRDADGYSNADEFWAATNPNDSNSVLRIQGRYDRSNEIILSWPSAPGRSYVLMSSTNLADWTSFPPIAGDGATMAIANPGTGSRMFYRLRVEP
jgi:glucose/arabinose dehydrogenase/sugar lactone lactonase YvrE